ncbi:hypothetical protein DVA86_01825 [Streptomyces armeniacus]|uniref:Uncharacterized protein n=1 Tax=Streptomyces armeniacus TaxID=83291 RepID=A0A345XIV4_9ACTN|nr:hypothetical protein DVA86_01825 [Streptomyces armeniacus]
MLPLTAGQACAIRPLWGTGWRRWGAWIRVDRAVPTALPPGTRVPAPEARPAPYRSAVARGRTLRGAHDGRAPEFRSISHRQRTPSAGLRAVPAL